MKGGVAIDWDDPAARQQFLAGLVADADRLLETVRATRSALVADSAEDTALAAAAGLLSRVLAQDIERPDGGVAIRQGTAPDRLVSIHDPEMRHGRKSATKRFDGHTGALAVDTDEPLITAVAVLAGNAPDDEDALALVEQTAVATESTVAETDGDCAYGSGETRPAFAAAGRVLHAKVPVLPNHGGFPKTVFHIDLATYPGHPGHPGPTCTCPGGHTTAKLAPTGRDRHVFVFPAAVGAACPLRPQCLTEPNSGPRGPAQTTRRTGRTILLHPQEALLQQARAFQASPAFATVRRRRQTVEHRLARLIQLGLRQARYVGRAKTLFQLAMATTVANRTLLVAADAAGLGTAAVALAGTAALLTLLMCRQHTWLALSTARSRLARCTRSWRHAAPVPRLAIATPHQLAASRPDF